MTSKDFSPGVKEEAISVPFNDLKLSVPSKLLVIGPSGSGKTRFLAYRQQMAFIGHLFNSN